MKRNANEEVVEKLKGYSAASASLASWAAAFNEVNGAGRMTVCWPRTSDSEGSGEYYEAVCLNINEAESAEAELYEIVSGC